ncbi:tyrosine-type recombinase/integrase [Actinocatenispora rupis]|uniref:Site-specific recombinase XerD n=1 Tax=Actinocatenispora rupis TaxID=519421 RepID=A0A8J3J909_9ACTN|nr:site-specific integrase [Actinocatenispora rupis]GID14117.1 hypothetical protein Aru02nite_50060 [Actinocatenispora rupis]
MAHIEDRWFKPRKDADGHFVLDAKGRKVLEPTSRHRKGDRYRVRYVDPFGNEKSRSFPDGRKRAADAFLVEVESTKMRGAYVDPDAGRVMFREYAENFIRTHAVDESTRQNLESRVRKHLYPYFGHRQIKAISPGVVREWNHEGADGLADSSHGLVFASLKLILGAAVDDGRIPKNPCLAKSVKKPRVQATQVVPWEFARVRAVRAGLEERFRLMVDVGAGCGLRQGEIFGLAADDIDTEAGWIHVRRQVKLIRGGLAFGLPKNDRERRIPLSATIGRALLDYMATARYEPAEITLPWENPASDETRTASLVFTTKWRRAHNRNTFNHYIWRPALTAAGVVPGRTNGMHALRHFYASALLDAGENIKALSAYLGHHDPGFTLRTYTHLMPASEDRTRRAIEQLFSETPDRDGPGTAPEAA